MSWVAALYGGPVGRRTISDEEPTDPRPDARPIYARGKIAAEAALRRLHAERGLPVTIARPGVVLGDGTPMQHSGIGLWVRDNHCVGWGRGRRPSPLVLVDDVAAALARLAAYEKSDLDGKALNLSSRQHLHPGEVIAELAKKPGRDFHFHPRPMWISQAMEIGKWIVKQVGGRRDAPFPSYHDLKSRSMWAGLSCTTARETLGWKPVDDADEILRRMLPPTATPDA